MLAHRTAHPIHYEAVHATHRHHTGCRGALATTVGCVRPYSCGSTMLVTLWCEPRRVFLVPPPIE
jgi:hypothetical protein